MKPHHSDPLSALIAHERSEGGYTVRAFCRECGISVKTYYRLLEKKIHLPELCQGHRLPLQHQVSRRACPLCHPARRSIHHELCQDVITKNLCPSGKTDKGFFLDGQRFFFYHTKRFFLPEPSDLPLPHAEQWQHTKLILSTLSADATNHPPFQKNPII